MDQDDDDEYSKGPSSTPSTYKDLLLSFRSGCDSGDSRACYNYGHYLIDILHKYDEGNKVLRGCCDNGEPKCCTSLGERCLPQSKTNKK